MLLTRVASRLVSEGYSIGDDHFSDGLVGVRGRVAIGVRAEPPSWWVRVGSSAPLAGTALDVVDAVERALEIAALLDARHTDR